VPVGSDLRGRIAIANARSAYWRYRKRFTEERWLILHDAGAKPQRPLWASTGTKDPAYSDVLYVDELVVPDAINTMPEVTLRAFADHGRPGGSFDWSSGAVEETLRRAEAAGVDLDAITAELERAGVESFCQSYEELLRRIESKLAATVLDVSDSRAADRWSNEGGPVSLEPGTRGRA
jgi:transaldolase